GRCRSESRASGAATAPRRRARMPLVNGTAQSLPEIDARRDELTAWRRDLHAHPELAYEERRTSSFVASELRRLGLDVDVGLARTGVVATLAAGDGPSIGLRADMDALPIREANRFAHRSRFDGRMHACG